MLPKQARAQPLIHSFDCRLVLEHFAKKRSLTVEAVKADAVRLPAATCSLEYPESTISSIARTAAVALTTAAFAVLKGYRKKGKALMFKLPFFIYDHFFSVGHMGGHGLVFSIYQIPVQGRIVESQPLFKAFG